MESIRSDEKDFTLTEEIERTSVAKAPQTSGNVQLLDEDGAIRRIPIPSDNPNDPLNFNKWRKLMIVASCCWFSIFSLVLVGGIGPILSYLFALYLPQGVSAQSVVNLSTYPSLVMAFGAFVILPSAVVFGRRPTYLFCSILLLGSTIGSAVCQSYNAHLATRILQGIATGATESVLPLIITDITFVDERGFWFGVYWACQSTFNSVFLICGSYLVQATSWRWFYWVLAILCSVGIVLGFLFLCETRFNRSPTAINGQVIHTDEWGVTQILSHDEFASRNITMQHDNQTTANDKQMTFVQHLKPFSSKAPNAFRTMWGTQLKMLKACSSPGVIFALLLSSITIGIGIAMSLVYGSILIAGYHWSPESVGLFNIGVVPASLLAMVYAGYIGDKMNVALAKRRGGVHLPEDTLVQLIVPFFGGIIGIVSFAVGAMWPERYSAWSLIMGWAIFQFSFVVILIVGTHFAAEAYPQNPGPALVVVVGAKNIISFAAAYGIVPMVHKYNYITAFMILLAFYVGISLLAVPVYFFNPRWRERIAKKAV